MAVNGKDIIKSKPISDAYREGWERTFCTDGKPDDENDSECMDETVEESESAAD
jgi:hypothetical protein